MNTLFASAVVGGTFDHFHRGHERLLDEVFSKSEHVTIGVSTETLYSDKFLAKTIENFSDRNVQIQDYLQRNNYEAKSKIVHIDDIYGTTLVDKDIDVIFVTKENEKVAHLINSKRKSIGFPLLEIVVVPFVLAEDGKPIASGRIRKGEIDRNGFVYSSLFENKSLLLPAEMRTKLREPIGFVTKDIHEILSKLGDAQMVISVGDIVTFSLAEVGAQADLSIIDFKTRRHALKEHEKALLRSLAALGADCTNQAGKIEHKAAKMVLDAVDTFLKTGKKNIIKIEGEEDLLTLPAILSAPLGSLVIYGQYDEGAVAVTVTEEKKREVTVLVKHFTQE